MNIEDQTTGIQEEIHFWEKCLINLQHIRQQFQRIELQNIIRVLTMSKSAYLQQFLQAEKEVQVKEYSNQFLLINKIRILPSMSKIV